MKKILCLFVALTFVASIFASGIALSGVGARAISMGGAMRGLADDYTAVYWNPAGIAFQKTNAIALSLAGISYSGEVEASGVKYENDPHTYMFPNLYYAKKAESKFNYALGVYVPYGLGSQWDMMQAVNHYQPDSLNVVLEDGSIVGKTATQWGEDFDKYDTKAEISMIDFHPSFSYKITDCLSFGLGLSVVYGDIKLIKTQIRSSLVDLGNGSFLQNIVPISMDMEGNGIGFGGNFGFMYKPNERWSLGLSGKLPMKITLEGEADILLMANAHTASLFQAEPGIFKSTADIEAEMNLPFDIGFGGSYRVMPNFLLTADVTYTQWESFDEVPITFDGNDPTGTPMEDSKIMMNWDNVFRFSVGGEYAMKSMLFRAGYYLDQSPIPNETMGPTWPDISDKSSFNIGFGYKLNNIQFDAGYEYIMFPENEVTEPNVSADGTLENFPGIYNANIQAFNVGLTYSF